MSGILLSSGFTRTSLLNEAIFNNSFSIQEWQVPAGVTSFSAVGVGGGGGGVHGTGTGVYSAGGGGGGALAWVNDVPCTPGEIIKVFAGHGGSIITETPGVGVMGNPSIVYRQTPGQHEFEHVQLAIRASLGYDASMDRKRVTLVAGSPAVSIVTNESKFNGASYYFPEGNTGYLRVQNARRFNQGANDFTISLWVKHSSVGTVGQVYIVRQWASTNRQFRLASNVNGALFFSYQNNISISSANGIVSADGNWHHLAVTRSGTVIRMFYDGVQVASGAISGSMYFLTDLPVIIGQEQVGTTIGGLPFRGWMDDIVMVNGTALWTSNFTPPTAPIEAGTAFLSAGGGGAFGNSGLNIGGIFRYGDGGANGGDGGTGVGPYYTGAGGGAGGYTGPGGAGASYTVNSSFQTFFGSAGSGGGGGGGGALGGSSTGAMFMGAGGGVGIYGQGVSGAGGIAGDADGPGPGNYSHAQGGFGGSGGSKGADAGTITIPVQQAGTYGGGGGAYTWSGGGGNGGQGGHGVVRIIWGLGRSFPNNAY